MSDLVFRSRPLSVAAINNTTDSIRDLFGLRDTKYFPVAAVLENVIPMALDGYTFTVKEQSALGRAHGLTSPDELEIAIREDVYYGMIAGKGRDRFTGCHELGHLVLHRRQYMARHLDNAEIKIYEQPEWQANCFASCILMPERFVRQCSSLAMITKEFGVTVEAAKVRVKMLKMEGVA